MSQPFGFDAPTLAGILLDARRCNKRDDVTGALICRHDIYLQLLEGPENVVRAAYARICHDDRHAGIKELLNRKIQRRLFASWAMLHDPAKTCIWTEEEIANAALDRAEPTEIIEVYQRYIGSVRETGCALMQTLNAFSHIRSTICKW